MYVNKDTIEISQFTTYPKRFGQIVSYVTETFYSLNKISFSHISLQKNKLLCTFCSVFKYRKTKRKKKQKQKNNRPNHG